MSIRLVGPTVAAAAATLMIGAYVVGAQFIAPHDAGGTINTAVATSDLLYICQPSGTITDPLCPIDTAGPDETIYAAAEDLLPGSVRWQKLRVTNVGSDPWDIAGVSSNWAEVSDPSGTCSTIPEAVVFTGSTGYAGNVGPGVTALGKIVVSGYNDPVDGGSYDGGINDNHGPVPGSGEFQRRAGGSTYIHVSPGDYEDFLLGIRLPVGTPPDCLNVVWQLATTWYLVVHTP